MVYNTYLGRDTSAAPNTWTIGVELNGEDELVALTPQVRKGLTGTGALAASVGMMVPLNKREEQGVRWVGYLLWEYLEPWRARTVVRAAWHRARHSTGTITTTAKGAAPIRVTIDQNVCGDQLPDEAIVVDAQGRLANAVVILTGVKRQHSAEPIVMNEKCRFGPRVQLIAPKANVKTSSKDPVLHTTNAQLENGRSLFNVALPIAGHHDHQGDQRQRQRALELQHASVDARLDGGDERSGGGERRRRPVHDRQRAAGHLRVTGVARGAEGRAAESDGVGRQADRYQHHCQIALGSLAGRSPG